MSGTTPDFTTETLAGGVRYVLPRRALGKARYGGLVLAAFGMFITAFMCLWMGMPMAAGVGMLRDGEWFGWLLIGFGLLGLFGLIPGLGMLLTGIAIFLNKSHAVIEVRDGKLYAIEKFGLLRWKRKRPAERIRRLTITAGLGGMPKPRGRDETEPHEFFRDIADDLLTIEATGEDIKPLKLASGYPAETLRALAAELAERVDARGPAKLFDRDEEPAVEVVEQVEPAAEEPAERDRAIAAEQPTESDIAIDRHTDGVTLTVPPAGVWKSKGGLFSFGLLWTVFCVLIFGGMLAGMVFGESDEPVGIGETLALVGFAVVFLGVGVGMLLAGWNMGKRRAVIDLVGRTLLFTEVAPLKTKQLEWPANDLRQIEMGPSGIESNDVPIMCLLIHTNQGKTTKLMTGRAEPELEWIAAVLRVELGIDERRQDEPAVPTDDSGRPVQPADSLIGVDRLGDRITFAIPRRGLGKVWPMLLIGLVFAGIGIAVWIVVAGEQLDDGFQWSDIFEVGMISLWALIFGGGGAAAGISALVMAKRRYLIEAGGGMLVVERFGLIGRRRYEWPAEQIESIKVKFSGTTVGNRKYDELIIIPQTARKCRIGNGRPTHELEWLAATLRYELKPQMDTDAHG